MRTRKEGRSGAEKKGRLHRLWEGDVDRILLMVLTGHKQLHGKAWESRALADSVGPQAVVLAQSDIRVDLEYRSWPRSHVFPSKMQVGFNKHMSRRHLGHTEKVIKTPTLAYKAQAHALLARGIVQTRGACYLTDLGLRNVCKWEKGLVEAGL